MSVRALPRLHLISDRRLCPLDELVEVAAGTVAIGVGAVHLREKDLAGGPLLRAAQSLKDRLAETALVLINERVDVAMLAGADGVQIGEEGLPVEAVRCLAGADLLIGRSVHDALGATQAERDGADFVIAGHIYPTRSKPGVEAKGLDFLRGIVAACSIPVIAVGGITPERVPNVMACGAHGVAVISGILSQPDPVEAARHYHEALEKVMPNVMELVVNGKKVGLDGIRTVGDLLRTRGLKPSLVAVEHNGTIVPRSRFEEHQIAPGDRLEIVHFVGGG